MQATCGYEADTANRIIYSRRPGFKKGKSGNPAGRPKTNLKVRQLARENTMPAVRALMDIVANPKNTDHLRMQAARAVLSIGWNKPKKFDEIGVVKISEYVDYLRLMKMGFSSATADEYIKMIESERQRLIAAAQKAKQDEQDRLDLAGL